MDTGLAISSALSSLPSRPMQHFWENSFWNVMLGDSHDVMDAFSSGMKRPLPVRPDDGDDGIAVSDPVKVLRSFKAVCHDFMECVMDVAPHTWKEERESLQQISIRRWHSMLMHWHDKIQIVRILRSQEELQQQLQTIADIFYNKAPSTLMKRARSLARVTNYFNDRGLSFPCTEPQMYSYLCAERDGGAPGSRLKGVLEEVVFPRHVLGVIEFDEIIQSRRCSGAASVGSHHVIRQSTPLTVKQLTRLHEVLKNDAQIWNRLFAGMALFCTYSRVRWSDAQHSEKLLYDRDLSGTLAFLEAHATVHKTCRALRLRHQFLPLVAPAIGVTADLWGEGWLQCRSEMKILDLSSYPLMPAPSQDGMPTVRALTASEAGKWMRLLLGNPQSEDVAVKLTSHSFKATRLSMLSKRGCSFEDRLALGYHTSGLRIALSYSRDGASRPLAILCAVLREIRHGVYGPDETRSGRLVPELDVTGNIKIFRSRVLLTWP